MSEYCAGENCYCAGPKPFVDHPAVPAYDAKIQIAKEEREWKQRVQRAVDNTPEGMKLLGWLSFSDDKVYPYPLRDPLARPIYTWNEEL